MLKKLITNFHEFLKEKVLATKGVRAIFAIPKNDVETPHFKVGSVVLPIVIGMVGMPIREKIWIGSSVG